MKFVKTPLLEKVKALLHAIKKKKLIQHIGEERGLFNCQSAYITSSMQVALISIQTGPELVIWFGLRPPDYIPPDT